MVTWLGDAQPRSWSLSEKAALLVSFSFLAKTLLLDLILHTLAVGFILKAFVFGFTSLERFFAVSGTVPSGFVAVYSS